MSEDHFLHRLLRALMMLGVCMIQVNCTSESRHSDLGVKIQSVTLDARNKPSDALLPQLKRLGVTHITLVQFGFQSSIESTEIRMNPDARWYSESDQGIRELSKSADSLGLDIILKPHLWLSGYNVGGQSRNEIGYINEQSWVSWESDYTAFLMHYAHLSQEIRADVLVIGTELARSAHERPDYWKMLIQQVRSVYDGKLTYAANWWEEYEDIKFWHLLEYIGVQAYFELSDQPNPSEQMLAEGWYPYQKMLSDLSTHYDRPILFTELGYRNVDDAAAQPWRWPSRNEIGVTDSNSELQARLYTAFFNQFWNEPWFAGVIIWKWHGDLERRRTAQLGFTPQGKPSEDVMRQWFTANQ
ncbi:MAG: hypothetical protein OXE59_00925 [Bacteroidetes bacterium]|nr:hypothetical protein [Bacteroidota bacterium]